MNQDSTAVTTKPKELMVKPESTAYKETKYWVDWNPTVYVNYLFQVC
jgi:hypothetical protein